MLGSGSARSGGGGGGMPPHFRVCYLCGQQFGSASIGIHVPQCYQKKLSQWTVADPATRGNKPKHPDTVNWKGGKGASAEAVAAEQYKEFEANMVPCPGCGRTFFPDRLPVHMRGCKAAAGKSPQDALKSSTKSASGRASSSKGRSASAKRFPGGRPVLPTCYLCGQQFGTTSIGIHVPQCYAKKLAQWQAADPRTRGAAPKDPDTVNWRGTGATAEEQAESQYDTFVNNLEPCPNCGRRFLPDRLIVHQRSCRPGNAAKPVHQRQQQQQPSHSSTGASPAEEHPPERQEEEAKEKEAAERINPKTNRLPKAKAHGDAANKGRSCPRCTAVECDPTAKFCRECGQNLSGKNLSEPCKHCGEPVPEGSRFCSTCGNPINGAAGDERGEGVENANVPTVRVVSCPGCKAICDADGNFCDSCGAALGEAEPLESRTPANDKVKATEKAPKPPTTGSAADGSKRPQRGAAAASSKASAPSAAPPVPYMYCESCNEAYDDTSAVFCEECGGKLVERTRLADAGALPPPTATSTLPPSLVEQLSPRGSAVDTTESAEAAVAAVAAAAAKTREAKKRVSITAEDPKPKGKPFASPPSTAPNVSEMEPFAPPQDVGDRQECPSCGRFFAPESYTRHVNICQKQKSRPVFNSAKKRLSDVDVKPPKSAGSGTKGRGKGSDAAAAVAPKKNWKAESEAFRRALREARQADQVLKSGGTAKDLPPPTYSENPDYVQCPHCQRRFAPETAERHIPKCANTISRPKPPPKRKR